MWQVLSLKILFVAAILGLIPAFIASSKGRSFALWWVYGLLLFIVALIHSIFIKRDYAITEQLQMEEGLAKCPFCAEMIKPEAIKCKHCGSDVTARVSRGRALPSPNLGEMDVVVRDAAGNATLNCEAIAAMATELNNKMSNHSAYSIMSTYYPTISRIKERLDEQTGKDFEVALEEAIRFEKRKR